MCGICGKIDPHGPSEEEIQRMAAVLSHRGPDDEGIFVRQNVGFGHRRLSVIAIEDGHQPMSNEDGNLWITFNGEIYNFREIREDLKRDHAFKTKSDTEVILHLYAEKREKCVQDLRGMFAFAIYDFREKKLFLARDHLGQKPVYYFQDGDTFAFASEIKSLLALNPKLRVLDGKALYEYLTLRIITPPRSMFRNIRKLPPGHFLTYQNGKITIKRYWRLKYEPKLSGDFRETLTELEKQLQSAVQYHLVSDVPIGAFLSGGMDSSLVVAIMSKLIQQPIKTFSGDLPYKNYSEIPYAIMVSNKYKTENHRLSIHPSLLRLLPDLVWHLDEPSDPLSVCMYYISELTRKHVKVVLGGDGGDELFGGYDRYYGNVFANYYGRLPDLLRQHVLGRILNLIPEGFWYRSLSHKLRWLHQMSFFHGGERYAKSLSYFYFSDVYRGRLLTQSFKKSIGLFDPEESIKSYFESDNAKELIDKMLYADTMIRMPDHPIMILDRMTMAHGLEARSPFLDHKLVEFCAAIPPRFKVRGNRRRYIQTELAKKYLPVELIKRKKQGFSSPLTYLLADEFRSLYKIFLNGSHLVRDGFFNSSAIETLLEEHLNRKLDHGNRLWLLCNAEVWYRICIENESRDKIRNLLSTGTPLSI
ncbi:MAG: asparagine synthase (glutamine-hydrolyzing) [Desulfobacterales bacterium CG23_combo_of_CG06-09_8_20_14_all_52_9]|nr:MAG: asparagine synthase (glutamine-hydrolyzing) [Desulfobacterales bacterium CG23_combo_of_CG06-09_8_20_14_all_52_9]